MRHPFVDEALGLRHPLSASPTATTPTTAATSPAARPAIRRRTGNLHGYLPSDKGYYHGGDLAGLRRKLPYLDQLGVSAVWVGPIYARESSNSTSPTLVGHSSSLHGYWIRDFLSVDPHLGTNEEFARPWTAHDRGIKVFMDIVTNHTADVIQLEGHTGYRKDAFLIHTAGQPLGRPDYAYAGQPDYSFPRSAPRSPTCPWCRRARRPSKNPAWLNDPLLYHNRGNLNYPARTRCTATSSASTT